MVLLQVRLFPERRAEKIFGLERDGGCGAGLALAFVRVPRGHLGGLHFFWQWVAVDLLLVYDSVCF